MQGVPTPGRNKLMFILPDRLWFVSKAVYSLGLQYIYKRITIRLKQQLKLNQHSHSLACKRVGIYGGTSIGMIRA